MIDVKGVHKSFGELEVLKGIDLDVPAGAVTVILGPSGSGKSTLLRSINHLEKVDRGLIKIDGELIGYRRRGNKLHELREREILRQRSQVGFVFQTFNLFGHLTVLQNVVEAPVSAQRRKRSEVEPYARELLERVGVGDKADVYPRQLSGGLSGISLGAAGLPEGENRESVETFVTEVMPVLRSSYPSRVWS